MFCSLESVLDPADTITFYKDVLIYPLEMPEKLEKIAVPVRSVSQPLKVLYLMSMEKIYGYGIFETQVKNILKEIRKQHPDEASLTFLAILPAVHINRKGIHWNAFRHSSELKQLKMELRGNGIDTTIYYVPVPRWSIYLKSYFFPIFLATALPFLAAYIRYKKFDVVHCRSYLPAYLCVLLKKMGIPIKVLFDTRAPLPEQGVVAGHYGYASPMYRLWKKIEAICLKNCDVTVAISEEFAEELKKILPDNRIEVIHNTVNVKDFLHSEEKRLKFRKELGITDKIVLVYNGSLGVWNDPELMVYIFQKLRKSIGNMFLMVFTGYEREKLSAFFRRKGIPETSFKILYLDPTKVPLYLSVGDYGLWPSKVFHRNSSIERTHATVTGVKTFEYLAAGLPIIANENMIAVKALVEKYRAGITFNPDNIPKMVEDFKDLIGRYKESQIACREVANRLANVEVQSKKYFQIYISMTSPNGIPLIKT